MRMLKDEPVPEGYLRFRFNEDCQYQHCGYREHQTHFHCQRQDCGYSFCDKTRFVQHTARHERLDTLMGGDFQQYRANVACGRPDCAYTTNLGELDVRYAVRIPLGTEFFNPKLVIFFIEKSNPIFVVDENDVILFFGCRCYPEQGLALPLSEVRVRLYRHE